jgi:hypothetical protein
VEREREARERFREHRRTLRESGLIKEGDQGWWSTEEEEEEEEEEEGEEEVCPCTRSSLLLLTGNNFVRMALVFTGASARNRAEPFLGTGLG